RPRREVASVRTLARFPPGPRLRTAVIRLHVENRRSCRRLDGNVAHQGKGDEKMETSKTLAGLIGPTLVAFAASMLLNLSSLPAVIGQASGDAALITTTGAILFVAGLAIVRVHNRWSGDWPVVVTVLGWLFVLGGLVRTLFPIQLGLAASAMAQE